MTNYFFSDETKTIAEYYAIIDKYQLTELLERQDAIKKYISFNTKYKDFYFAHESIALASNSNISIQNASDKIIVENLKIQLAWLTSKTLSKDN